MRNVDDAQISCMRQAPLCLTAHLFMQDIKKIYRKKSLLVHPDKCKHEKAQEAFDVLKKAQEV
jgi:DnaJ-class molecular chaperone